MTLNSSKSVLLSYLCAASYICTLTCSEAATVAIPQPSAQQPSTQNASTQHTSTKTSSQTTQDQNSAQNSATNVADSSNKEALVEKSSAVDKKPEQNLAQNSKATPSSSEPAKALPSANHTETKDIKLAQQSVAATSNQAAVDGVADNALDSLLSPEERKAVEQEAARQNYQDQKPESENKDDESKSADSEDNSRKNPYSYRDDEASRDSMRNSDSKDDNDKNTSSLDKEDDKPQSQSSLRRRSFTTYSPGRQSPARNLKATPGQRAFGGN